MQTLYRPQDYNKSDRALVKASGRIGVAIANRWMLGWPELTKELMRKLQFRQAFKEQLKAETEVLAMSKDRDHLAEVEIVQMAGLSLMPPAVE